MELSLDVTMPGVPEKCKAFLYVIGKEGREIFNTCFSKGKTDTFTPLLAKFENYCIPKKNVTVERHNFNIQVQGSTELIDQFVTDLKTLP